MEEAIELANSDLYVSPLTWKEAGSEKPSTGTEIKNDLLAAALEEVEFTKDEWDKFQVAHLSSDSYIRAGNRYFTPTNAHQWKAVGSEKPSTGTEIKNGPLAAALQNNQVKFTKEQWDAFEVRSVDGWPVNPGGDVSRSDFAADLSGDSYIKAGIRYFKPEIKLCKDLFIDSIKGESAARAKVYKDEDGAWFNINANFGKAVMDGLGLSTLAKAHYDLWLRDTNLTWMQYDPDDTCTTIWGGTTTHLHHDFQRSYGRLLAMQREDLTVAEKAALEVEGSDDDLKRLALEECLSRRWITDEKDLQNPDDTTSFTPIMTHLSLGDLKVAERLLQARANPEAVPTKDKEGKTPLIWACKEGDADATLLLLKYKADIEAKDSKVMYTTDLFFYVLVYR
jgi:hypothetical protein